VHPISPGEGFILSGNRNTWSLGKGGLLMARLTTITLYLAGECFLTSYEKVDPWAAHINNLTIPLTLILYTLLRRSLGSFPVPGVWVLLLHLMRGVEDKRLYDYLMVIKLHVTRSHLWLRYNRINIFYYVTFDRRQRIDLGVV